LIVAGILAGRWGVARRRHGMRGHEGIFDSPWFELQASPPHMLRGEGRGGGWQPRVVEWQQMEATGDEDARGKVCVQ
jgi:hypothetical protein